jgi:hypothetical protein
VKIWVGQGCSMQSSAEGLNSNPCMRIEGTVASKISRHRKLERYYGPARYNFYRLDLVPFLVPLCYRIARAYGIASTARRLKLP